MSLITGTNFGQSMLCVSFNTDQLKEICEFLWRWWWCLCWWMKWNTGPFWQIICEWIHALQHICLEIVKNSRNYKILRFVAKPINDPWNHYEDNLRGRSCFCLPINIVINHIYTSAQLNKCSSCKRMCSNSLCPTVWPSSIRHWLKLSPADQSGVCWLWQ